MMQTRREPHRHRYRFGRVRAVLSLGILLGLGSATAAAQWNTARTIDPGTLAVGSLDVSVDGEFAGPAQIDGSTVRMDLRLYEMLPAELWAYSFTATNSGTMPLILQTSIYGEGQLTPGMAARSWSDASVYTPADESSTDVRWDTYRRTADCTGGTLLRGWFSLASDPSSLEPPGSTEVLLEPGESRSYCVRLTLRGSRAVVENTSYLGADATVTLVFQGTQVGAL